MNIAILSKIKVISDHPIEHIKEFKAAVRLQRLEGLYEVAYYLSINDPLEFYNLSLWFNLEGLSNYQQEKEKLVYSQLTDQIKLEERTVFKLLWDYRKMEIKPGMSVLRLARFPKDYPYEWLEESETVIKEQAHQSPGFLGAWMGYNQERTNSDGNLIRLLRGDWASKEAFLNYANSPAMRAITERSRAVGVAGWLASADLQDIVQPSLSEQDTPHVGLTSLTNQSF